jgi:glucosyl-dolichyl phosphate glucuronosyltransferase
VTEVTEKLLNTVKLSPLIYEQDQLATTIVVATHNGSRTLEETLDSFRKLHHPNGVLDIVVVDNASTDKTKSILRSFVNVLPLSIVHEQRRGKNIALNRVVSDISSDLIVFTDDDVVPRSDWLEVLQKAAQEQKEYAIFGGKIIPRWPYPPPSWLLAEISLGVVYAVTPPDLTDGPIDPDWVWGPNMCVRKEVFNSGLRFNEAVGPTHGDYIMGSETNFTARAQAHGFKSWHVSNAVVEHMIREEQMELEWIVRRARRFGRALGYADYANLRSHNKVRGKRIFGMPLWRIRKGLRAAMLSQWHRLSGDEKKWFRNAYAANENYGFLYEIARRKLTDTD